VVKHPPAEEHRYRLPHKPTAAYCGVGSRILLGVLHGATHAAVVVEMARQVTHQVSIVPLGGAQTLRRRSTTSDALPPPSSASATKGLNW